MIDAESQLQALHARYQSSLPSKRSDLELAWRSLGADSSNPAHLESLTRLVHRLAGSAPSYGFQEIGEIAGKADDLLGRSRQLNENESCVAARSELLAQLTPLITLLLQALEQASATPGHLPATLPTRHS